MSVAKSMLLVGYFLEEHLCLLTVQYLARACFNNNDKVLTDGVSKISYTLD
jgi:hypothetical protein